jgi:hypothetical protein
MRFSLIYDDVQAALAASVDSMTPINHYVAVTVMVTWTFQMRKLIVS